MTAVFIILGLYFLWIFGSSSSSGTDRFDLAWKTFPVLVFENGTSAEGVPKEDRVCEFWNVKLDYYEHMAICKDVVNSANAKSTSKTVAFNGSTEQLISTYRDWTAEVVAMMQNSAHAKYYANITGPYEPTQGDTDNTPSDDSSTLPSSTTTSAPVTCSTNQVPEIGSGGLEVISHYKQLIKRLRVALIIAVVCNFCLLIAPFLWPHIKTAWQARKDRRNHDVYGYAPVENEDKESSEEKADGSDPDRKPVEC